MAKWENFGQPLRYEMRFPFSDRSAAWAMECSKSMQRVPARKHHCLEDEGQGEEEKNEEKSGAYKDVQ